MVGIIELNQLLKWRMLKTAEKTLVRIISQVREKTGKKDPPAGKGWPDRRKTQKGGI